MRVIQKAKVNRASRKLMGFYRSAYDFRPPFTVVLDAGVIAAAQTRGIELKTEIPKLLGGRARLVVTRYTVKELRKRGKEAKPCVAFAERLKYVSVEARGARVCGLGGLRGLKPWAGEGLSGRAASG